MLVDVFSFSLRYFNLFEFSAAILEKGLLTVLRNFVLAVFVPCGEMQVLKLKLLHAYGLISTFDFQEMLFSEAIIYLLQCAI